MKPHESVQLLSLACIARWRPKYLMPYLDSFKRLVAPKSFREELAVFRLQATRKVGKDDGGDDADEVRGDKGNEVK